MEKSGQRRASAARPATEDLGLAALAFIAARPELAIRFLDLSGLSPGDLRRAAADPGFLDSALDFVLGSEMDAAAFAEERRLTPDALQRALARRARADDPRDDG